MVKGLVQNSLQGFDRKIAILHVDLDLYDGHVATLTNLFECVAEGGIIMFDEYLERVAKFPGPTKAINKFFGDKVSEIQPDEGYGKYYLLKRDHA